MGRYFYENDLKNIVYGSSFFGGGGGGSAEEGLHLIELMKEEKGDLKVEVAYVKDMKENETSTMVAALGSPIATKGRTFQHESVNAVIGMEAEAKALGKELNYVYSGEQGGGNTMLPIYAAWKTGKPILDTDGNGRAVPELNTGLAPIYNIPTSPVILASELGDTITGRTKDPLDGKSCEKIARYMCQAYDQGIGFAAWMMNREDHEKTTVIGQMSMTKDVGHLLSTYNEDELLIRLKDYFEEGRFRVLVKRGTITDIKVDASGGFDTGYITIDDNMSGTYKVLYQNENLVAYKIDSEGKEIALATVPSIISLIQWKDGKGTAVSNSEIEVGMEVALTVTKADKKWYDNPEGWKCWSDVMISAGYCDVRKQIII